MIGFWVSVLLLAYHYVAYPLILQLLPIRPAAPPPDPVDWPRISVLLSAYDEASHIRGRIENLLALDYPSDRLEVWVGVDGACDGTEAIARTVADRRVRVVAFPARRGKLAILNDLARRATGDVLVLTDANVLFADDAVRRLARHFSTPSVGAVCGRLAFVGDPETSEHRYWDHETLLKERESRIDSCLGTNGAIAAFRAACWPRLADDTLVEDFVLAMRVREGGFKVVFDQTAVALEDLPTTVRQEMGRRARIGAGAYQALGLCWRSLLPWRGRYVWCYWSHKVLRWLSPFLLLMALGTNLALLDLPLYRILLGGQVAFYALAALGAVGRSRPFRLPHYFVALHLALLLGFWRFVTRTQPAAWVRTARSVA
jgi:cellulose synthase/poly-beta-1,6-N-acetylglucosamine synthase-like glycosyltransferase